MPNSPSASKRLRQSAKRRLHNRITKKVIKTHAKRTIATVATKDLDKANADLNLTISKLDKAAARGVLHRNTVARRKSKLVRDYHAAVAKASGTAAP